MSNQSKSQEQSFREPLTDEEIAENRTVIARLLGMLLAKTWISNRLEAANGIDRSHLDANSG